MRIMRGDIAIARREAEAIGKRHSRSRRFTIELGERQGPHGTSVNILAVTDDPVDWDDTDLYDHRPWSWLRAPGVPLHNGRAMVDCYLYEWERGERADLVCNAQLEFDERGLLAVHADAAKNVWRRSQA